MGLIIMWILIIHDVRVVVRRSYTAAASRGTGVAFFLNGFPTHWKAKEQPSISLSSAAAEMYALSEACKDARLRYWISDDMGYPICM